MLTDVLISLGLAVFVLTAFEILLSSDQKRTLDTSIIKFWGALDAPKLA
jgi:hypothetical protein